MLSCNEHCVNYHAFKESESDSLFQNKTLRESVHIQSYSGPYFPAFGLNTDQNNSEYGHFSRREKSKQKYHMEWLN